MSVRRARRWAASLAAVAALAGGYLHACAGPRPEVERTWAEPLAGGVRAVASVRNRGGEGQIEVTFRLVDRRTGRVYAREESAPVRRGGPTEIATWVAAPPGDYQIEAEAQYPPR